MIYFDANKQACAFVLENYLCKVEDELWREFSTLTLGEDYDVDENGIIDLRKTEKYKEKIKQSEKEKILKLSLTKREVFLALFKDKGITPEEIRNQITNTSDLIEFDYAAEYYRGNPLIDFIGEKLGYSSDDLDYLFQNKEFPKKDVD